MVDATNSELTATPETTSPMLVLMLRTQLLQDSTPGKSLPVLTEPETPSPSRTGPTDMDSCFTHPRELDSSGTNIFTRKTPLSTSLRDSWEEVYHSCQLTREDISFNMLPTMLFFSTNITARPLSKDQLPGMLSRASADLLSLQTHNI